MAIDTPNGLVCRLQQASFIDPDHKVEYTLGGAEGQGHGGRLHRADRARPQPGWPRPWPAGVFDQASLAANRGIYYDAAGLYLLALVIQKPG